MCRRPSGWKVCGRGELAFGVDAYIDDGLATLPVEEVEVSTTQMLIRRILSQTIIASRLEADADPVAHIRAFSVTCYNITPGPDELDHFAVTVGEPAWEDTLDLIAEMKGRIRKKEPGRGHPVDPRDPESVVLPFGISFKVTTDVPHLAEEEVAVSSHDSSDADNDEEMEREERDRDAASISTSSYEDEDKAGYLS